MLTTPRQSDDYYCQSQWQSISLYMIGLYSIGLMRQFHSQHYSHPAVDCRVVIPAMTITDSTHQPLASIWHFVSHKESCMTSQHSIFPHSPSRIVTLVWTASLPFECDVIYGRPHPIPNIAARRSLRSVNCHLRSVRRYWLNPFGRRAFAVVGPTAWNYSRQSGIMVR